MPDQSLASLSSLSRELGINKSKLAYYHSLGLIKSTGTVGGVFTFERKSTLAILKFIVKTQNRGTSLMAIKQTLDSSQLEQ